MNDEVLNDHQESTILAKPMMLLLSKRHRDSREGNHEIRQEWSVHEYIGEDGRRREGEVRDE